MIVYWDRVQIVLEIIEVAAVTVFGLAALNWLISDHREHYPE
jgi:hypothetical protein